MGIVLITSSNKALGFLCIFLVLLPLTNALTYLAYDHRQFTDNITACSTPEEISDGKPGLNDTTPTDYNCGSADEAFYFLYNFSHMTDIGYTFTDLNISYLGDGTSSVYPFMLSVYGLDANMNKLSKIWHYVHNGLGNTYFHGNFSINVTNSGNFYLLLEWGNFTSGNAIYGHELGVTGYENTACTPTYVNTTGILQECNTTNKIAHHYSTYDATCGTGGVNHSDETDCSFKDFVIEDIMEEEKMIALIILWLGLWALGYFAFQTKNELFGGTMIILTIPIDLYFSYLFQEVNMLGTGFLGIAFAVMTAWTIGVLLLMRRTISPA